MCCKHVCKRALFKELNLLLNCTLCNIQVYIKLFSLPFLFQHRVVNFVSSEVLTSKDEKIMAFVFYFKKEKSRSQETRRRKKNILFLGFVNSEHCRPSWESTQVISLDKISAKKRVHSYIQDYMWEILIKALSVQEPYLRDLFQICPGFI